MAKRLYDIDVDEISLVDIPAIKRKFLIIKRQEANMDKETLENVEKKETEVEKALPDKIEGKQPKKEEAEKAGAKFSKEDKEKIRTIAKQILSLIEEDVMAATEVKKAEPLIDMDEIAKYVTAKTEELLKSK